MRRGAARAEHAAVPSARRRIGRRGRRSRSPLFAVLAVTAAAQTSADSVAQERASDAHLIDQVERRARPRSTPTGDGAATCGAEIDRLEHWQLLHDTSSSGSVLAELELLALRSRHRRRSRGPGVRVVVDDAPGRRTATATRCSTPTSRSWSTGSGRPAPRRSAINGQRLTNLSRDPARREAITVNYRSLRRPYRSSRSATTNTLPVAVRGDHRAGRHGWICSSRWGCRFDMTTAQVARLPAADASLRYATPEPRRRRSRRDRRHRAGRGIVLGLVLTPDVPQWLEPYLPIAVVAALDAVFGALAPSSTASSTTRSSSSPSSATS